MKLFGMAVYVCVLCWSGHVVKAHILVVSICLPLTCYSTWPMLVSADGDVLAIKEHLIDELDYILVPMEGWNKLVSWYGLTEGQEPIARKVSLQK